MIHDPLRGLSEERIAAITRDYKAGQSIRYICSKFSMGQNRLTAILTKLKLKRPRSKTPIFWTGKAKRSIADVFLGAKKLTNTSTDAELDAAKNALRQRGYIVYDATVTDGPRSKGLVKVDHVRMTRDAVIALASRRMAA